MVRGFLFRMLDCLAWQPMQTVNAFAPTIVAMLAAAGVTADQVMECVAGRRRRRRLLFLPLVALVCELHRASRDCVPWHRCVFVHEPVFGASQVRSERAARKAGGGGSQGAG